MKGKQEKQKTYAYVRVSSDKQNEARQLKEIYELGVPKRNIIIDKTTGKNFKRQKYHELIKRLKSGDTLYISSVDRLGRDYDGIISEWKRLTKENKIIIKVLDMPLLNTDRETTGLIDKFVADIVLLTMAYQAEQEWHNIKARQEMGIAIAKENGKHLGRPKITYSDDEIKVVKDWKNGLLTLGEATKKLGRKKSMLYKLVHELK